MSSTQATILKYEDVFKKKVESENIQNIQLSELHDYSNHPFKVQDDEAMEELVQSIRDKGVLEPIDVRPMDQGGYEILSGHRRVHACRKLGLLTIPCTIRRLDDEEAADLMVYSNYKRDRILPSEKARAYQIQLDYLRHQGKRGQNTAEAIGRKFGESSRKVLRIARLTHLREELLKLVDDDKLSMQAGYAISYLSDSEQKWVSDCCARTGKYPGGAAAECMKAMSQDGLLTKEKVSVLISGKHREARSLILKPDLIKRYFPSDYSQEDMMHTVLMLLTDWRDSQDLKNKHDDPDN